MNTTLTAYESCYRKKLYWTEDEAKEAVTREWSRHGVPLHTYACLIGNHGEHWHIGHQSARSDAIQRLRTFGRDTVLTNEP
jgi:hypothetical protein